MRTYRSSPWVIIKNVFYGLFGGFVGGLVASWFMDQTLAIAIGIGLALLVVYFAAVSDNIRLELDAQELRVFRLGKLKQTFPLTTSFFKAKVRTTYVALGADSDCHLTITDGQGKTTQLDCSMLGKRCFMQLLTDMGIVGNDPPRLDTTRKL